MSTTSQPSSSSVTATEDNVAEERKKYYKGLSFWLVILGINISSFMALLEATIISNALPTIVSELQGGNYVWVGSGYNLAAAAIMPSTGVLAQIFGRKAVLISALLVFSLGCALCGAAQSMAMLIGGRVVQGLGGAGILSTSFIIISDIVPLSERGVFNGLLQLTWCLASGIGPVVGGTLAEQGHWRWIFYLNLPIAPIAGLLVVAFLNLKVPRRSWRENLKHLDAIGNVLIIGGSSIFAIGLTWGGIDFPWHSAHVIAPLCFGGVMLIAFIIYEYFWSPNPMVPVKLMLNRTTLSGYLQVMVYPIPFLALVYYFPVYLQACKGLSPIRSGVILFGIAFSTPPVAIIAGVSVTITKRYRPPLWIGWILSIVGLALLGTLHADSSLSTCIGYEILTGAGFGLVFSATYFPVLAPLPLTSAAHALAFYAFLRQFTQIWGITVGGVILQNQLQKRLPTSFFSQFPGGVHDILGSVQLLKTLPQPQLDLVRVAFAESLALVWQIMSGIMGLGLLLSFLMKHHELHTTTDREWGLKEKENNRDQEQREEKRETSTPTSTPPTLPIINQDDRQ